MPLSDKFLNSAPYNCSLSAPWANNHTKMYKTEKKLVYPVNVGRNIARESAVTHYVLASDIELYPNPNLPSKFLEMIRRSNQPELNKPNPKVFVLPIFEVEKNCQPPENKTSLVHIYSQSFKLFIYKSVFIQQSENYYLLIIHHVCFFIADSNVESRNSNTIS